MFCMYTRISFLNYYAHRTVWGARMKPLYAGQTWAPPKAFLLKCNTLAQRVQTVMGRVNSVGTAVYQKLS